MYHITIEFTGGTLKGLRYEMDRNFALDVGWECVNPIGNTSPYKVIACERIA